MKKAREELQLMWDYANNKRQDSWDNYRSIEDYFNKKELRVWLEIAGEEWSLSKLLGESPQWGSAKQLGSLLGPDAPVGMVTVKEDRSTKISFEYVELVDMMVKTINGKWSPTKWDWESVDEFKAQGWGRPADFNDYLKRWNDAETPEETEAVLEEYRNKYPNAIY